MAETATRPKSVMEIVEVGIAAGHGIDDIQAKLKENGHELTREHVKTLYRIAAR